MFRQISWEYCSGYAAEYILKSVNSSVLGRFSKFISRKNSMREIVYFSMSLKYKEIAARFEHKRRESPRPGDRFSP